MKLLQELTQLNEAAKEEFMNTQLDKWYQFFMTGNPGAYKPKKLPEKEKARRAYINGFRRPWGAGGIDGVGSDVQAFYDKGEKDGKVERKKFKGEVPVAKTRNRYGENKVNPAFEKLIKSIMAPYLEHFKDDKE